MIVMATTKNIHRHHHAGGTRNIPGEFQFGSRKPTAPLLRPSHRPSPPNKRNLLVLVLFLLFSIGVLTVTVVNLSTIARATPTTTSNADQNNNNINLVGLSSFLINAKGSHNNNSSNSILRGQPQRMEHQSFPKDDDDGNDHDHRANQEIRFISTDTIPGRLHTFSASWWQSKERFLRIIDPLLIDDCESTVWIFVESFLPQVRMTLDWLKFSVEHLSHAFRQSGFETLEETQSYIMFVEKLLDYTLRTLPHIMTFEIDDSHVHASNDSEGAITTPRTSRTTKPLANKIQYSHKYSSSRSAMMETIAIMSFMPYRSNENATRGKVLTTANLVASLVSLIRLYCGRIVIVLDHSELDDITSQIMMASKQFLLQQEGAHNNQHHQDTSCEQKRVALESFFMSFPSSSSSLEDNNVELLNVNATNLFEFQIYHTEIALAVVHCSNDDGTINTDDNMPIVPKAALLGLKKAFDNNDMAHTRQWLGQQQPQAATTTATTGSRVVESYKNSKSWKFIYITEPDTILNTQHEVLPALARELHRGNIVIPHRIQPIPHERDLPGYNPGKILPAIGNWSNVTKVGSTINDDEAMMTMMCCDAGSAAPGYEASPVNCSNYWWACGFVDNEKHDEYGRNYTTTASQRHYRLAHYTLMDLPQGTRIVSLAGSEHGRQCIPTMKKLPEIGMVDCSL